LKVIVLGSGKIGSVMAKDFSKTGAKITMSDISLERAKKAAQEIGADYTAIDTADYTNLVRKIEEYDLVLGALPGDYGFPALKAAIEARKNMVDVSFTPEDPLSLDQNSKKAGTTIIPDSGVAPGLSNLLVGYSASRLDKVEKAEIMVGGIPETRVPPLDYTITWSADGLIDEYIRDVNIIQNGEKVQVPALSGLENIQFPGVGTLEAFYTDGLRSLVGSLQGVENMYEKTLRYPGHVEKIKLLKELGFFSEAPVTVLGSEVTPKLVTARLLERSLWKPEIGDLLAMMIEVSGMKNGKKKSYKHTVLEYQDHETGVSAMARTTAYTASIVAQLLADGYIKEKGVIPMEKLGQDHSFVKKLFAELAKRDVEIKETET
jgi:saccharopine dehydrogenase-like NADP-dependent oxidoreductase